MARWRAAALERLPELRETVAMVDTIMQLWIELCLDFEKAYREPRDESLIARIYSFADWCVEADRIPEAGRDPLTAVYVAFYEEIPTIPAARQDMPRWFRHSEFLELQPVFKHHIHGADFEQLMTHMAENYHLYLPRERDRGGKS